jgi:ABC-type transport system substrate-binding protein
MPPSTTGVPFGADDVVATLKSAHAHPRDAARLPRGIAQVRRTGSHEVQIVAAVTECPGLPFLLSDPQFIILPAGNPEAAMRDAIGTGLYRVVPGATAERAVLRRVDRHYKDGQAGWFDRVEILAVPDPRARLEALKTGRVDAVNLPDPAWQDEIRRHGRIALAEVRGPAYLEIAVEGGTEDDAQAVLGALDSALDRGAMLSGVLQGRGRVAEPVAARAAHLLGGLPVAVRIAEERVPGRRALVREVLAAARRAGLSVVEDAPLVVVARLRPGRPTADWPALPGARLVPVHAHGLIAHSIRLQHGARIGGFWDMDSGRIAERWWYS